MKDGLKPRFRVEVKRNVPPHILVREFFSLPGARQWLSNQIETKQFTKEQAVIVDDSGIVIT